MKYWLGELKLLPNGDHTCDWYIVYRVDCPRFGKKAGDQQRVTQESWPSGDDEECIGDQTRGYQEAVGALVGLQNAVEGERTFESLVK